MAQLHRDMPWGQRLCGTGRLDAADGAHEGDGRAWPVLGTFPPPATPFVQLSSGYQGEISLPGLDRASVEDARARGLLWTWGKVSNVINWWINSDKALGVWQDDTLNVTTKQNTHLSVCTPAESLC